ncbi:MAG: ATP-binding protein [Candidatus Omnitrophota bacterium]|nr:ATP-binding protein [Candidatus Omnitrophota bacterium]
MNKIYSLVGLSIFLTSAILIFIILRSGKSKLHRTWALFNISVAIWGFGAFFIGRSSTPDEAFFWWRFAHIGIILMPVFIFQVISLLCDLRQKKLLLFVYFQGAIFLLFNIINPCKIFLSGVRYIFSSLYYGTLGPVYHPFFILWVFIVFFSHYELLLSYYKSHGIKRIQILYLLAATCLGFLGGITNFITAYRIDIFPYGNFGIPLYCLTVTYAILRFRLLDISLAITRTGIFITVYSLVLGVPFVIAYGLQPRLIAIFGNQWWIIPLISSTILATAGPFIYLYIQKRAEDRLLREQRAYQSTLRQASTGMNRIRDLQKLLNLIVHVVTRTVHLKNGAVYLYDGNKGVYILQAARDQGKAKIGMILPAKSTLIQKLLTEKEPLVYEEIKQRLQDYQDSSLAELEAQMKQIDAAVVVPSFAGENLLGFIVLGEKISGKLFSQDDLVVFSVLANQAALAIENAKFYEDIKKTQEQLFQAEKMATIGTMANGLSHQISNRLQALGFIAGDTLDTLKLSGDKPYPQEIKELLATIKSALERVQDNVKQGGEVVKGMLKYSRPGETGLEPTNLDKLITASIEMAQYKVKLSYLDIIRDYPKDLPNLRGNFTQLQEVFFNLIDNAYDATVQRKEEWKEPDYKGKITISASPQDEVMQIRFQDNGIGVKLEDLNKMFTPFFTTKTSSKKGTGLGLYVIQKIITGNHNGRIRVESKYRQGTTFVMELPLSHS